MDNVSHTLVSVALGAAICRAPAYRRAIKTAPAFASAVLLTSFIANNLPDVDTFIAFALQPGTLGNLLNHRGYTHTLAFVPLGAALTAFGVWLLSSRFKRRGWFWKLFLVGAVGILAHLFMDYWNDYGIHPFWPFSNRWFYGDILNVLEPLFWFALLPFAWEALSRTRVRFVLLGLSGGILGLAWLAPYTRGWVALIITLWALGAYLIQRRFHGLKPAVAMAVAVVGLSFTCSRVVHARVRAMFPDEKIFQLVGAPAPSDPFCWRIIVVSDHADQYEMRIGTLSLWPAVIHPRSCWYGVFDPHNAKLAEVTDAPASEGMAWSGEFVRPFGEFEALTRQSCEFEQFRRFSRAPFWEKWDSGTLFGDLRYDRGKGIGFSEFLSKGAGGCLRVVPPWQYPVQ